MKLCDSAFEYGPSVGVGVGRDVVCVCVRERAYVCV